MMMTSLLWSKYYEDSIFIFSENKLITISSICNDSRKSNAESKCKKASKLYIKVGLPVLEHVPRHALRQVPVRHVLKHVPRHVPKYVLDRHVPEHVLGLFFFLQRK